MKIHCADAGPLLEIKQVSLALDGCPVLKDVQFSMDVGQWVAINTRDGLAAHALTRLISREYEPSGGKVLFLGTLLQHWQGQDLMCQRCVLPNRWCSPLRGTVLDVVEQGVVLSQGETKQNVARELLGLFGLSPHASSVYVEQTEKVRQLALLARVLAQIWHHPGPKLVVIDQGLSALTAEEMNRLLSQLKQFLRHRGTSFLVLCSAPALQPGWADQRWQLQRGTLRRMDDSAPPKKQWWRWWQWSRTPALP